MLFVCDNDNVMLCDQQSINYHSCVRCYSGLSGSDVMMTEIHKTLLITCRDELVKNIDPEGILNKLISRKALTKHDAENIRSKLTRTSKVEELLDIIDLKPDRAFIDLINSLIDAGQKHLAKLLTGKIL